MASQPPSSNVPESQRPYVPDSEVPDRSDQIMDAFGLEGDWAEALTASESKISSPGASDGEAPPVPSAPAAGEDQAAAQPAQAPDPNAAPAGASPTPQPEQPAAQPPAPSAATTPAAASPTPEAEVQTLRAQLQAALQLLQGKEGGAPAPASQSAGQPAAPTPEGPSVDELQTYNIDIPQDVTNALFGDDPNQAAMAMRHLTNSLGRIVHQRVVQHVEHILGERLSSFSHQQTQAEQQRKIWEDYYAAFPDHNDQLTTLVVSQEAMEMWKADPTLIWNANTRDALGARVNAKLGRAALAPVTPTPTPAAATEGQQPAPKPAAMMGATTRPNGAGQKSAGEQITDILSAY